MVRHSRVEQTEPLLDHLLSVLGLKRKQAKNLLKFGAVAVNGDAVRQFDHPLCPGDVVTIGSLPAAVAANRLDLAQIHVVYEDDAIIVLDKPAGLLTVATAADKTDTLFVRANAFLHDRDKSNPQRALVVHRLDKETSGLVVFAKHSQANRRLHADWPSVRKTYLAVVEGQPGSREGTIRSYLTETSALQVYSNPHETPESRHAVTHYRLLQSRGDLSLIEVSPETGRKHQIRVHLASLGCAVAGDRRYGAKADPCHRLALHAAGLVLPHPLTGEALQLESPAPTSFLKLFRN